jgi:hypothetical protein
MVKTTKSNNYLSNTLGISEWKIITAKLDLEQNQGDTESMKLKKSSNIKINYNRWWLRRDDEYTMSLSDRRTKYGDCG